MTKQSPSGNALNRKNVSKYSLLNVIIVRAVVIPQERALKVEERKKKMFQNFCVRPEIIE